MWRMAGLVAGAVLLPLGGCLTCGEGTHEVLDQCILDVTSAESVQAICADGPNGSFTWDVEFPRDDAECSWGSDGNSGEKQGEVTARAEQIIQVDQTAGRLPCALDFNFEPDGYGQMIGYGDQFFITFGDAVILASSSELVSHLPVEGNLRLWSWEDLKGQDAVGDTSAWCPGQESALGSCTVGDPGDSGGHFLAFDPIITAELVWRAEQNDDYSFSIITVGDNDEDDCTNTRLKMQVTGSQARVE